MEVVNSELTAVMDGDLQHRVSDLVAMIHIFQIRNSVDLVVGVRSLDDENVGLSSIRKNLSLSGNRILKYFFNINTSDILSGFFVLRTKSLTDEIFKNRPAGFKILFHILSTATDMKVEEYPINFDKRSQGESKLNEKFCMTSRYKFIKSLAN